MKNTSYLEILLHCTFDVEHHDLCQDEVIKLCHVKTEVQESMVGWAGHMSQVPEMSMEREVGVACEPSVPW